MREIKFRVWSKEAEEMLEWEDLLTAPDLIEFLKCPRENGYYSKMMQYTGLKDCKRTKEYPEGQEIFEGDIVRNGGYPELCVVEFHEGQYIGRYEKDSYIGLGFYVTARNSITVIGNIYENPELLEG